MKLAGFQKFSASLSSYREHAELFLKLLEKNNSKIRASLQHTINIIVWVFRAVWQEQE